MKELRFTPLGVRIEPQLPLSKSLLARELLLDFTLRRSIRERQAYLQDSKHPVAEDVRVLFDALLRLESATSMESEKAVVLDCKKSGTALRFLSALAPFRGRRVFLSADPQLRVRPMDRFLLFVETLGCEVQSYQEGWLMVPCPQQRAVSYVDASGWESSQFVSGLMLVTPLMSKPWCLQVPLDLPSRSYIEMTRDVLLNRGMQVRELTETLWELSPDKSGVKAPSWNDESDWSASHPWFQLVACHPMVEEVFLEGLFLQSCQPDATAYRFFSSLGVEAQQLPHGVLMKKIGIEVIRGQYKADVKQNLDLFPSLVLTLIYHRRPFTIMGVQHLRYKESDRIQALQQGLEVMGYTGFTVTDDAFSWDGSGTPKALAVVDDRDDHRITMAFAIHALSTPNLKLQLTTPASVRKSYHGFWADLDLS